MKLKIDREADALYFNLTEESAFESEEVSPGIIVDFNSQGEVVGIEILHLSKRMSESDLRSLLFESVPLAA